MNNEVKEFTVKRKDWYRGRAFSALLRNDGQMCCLGFLGRACGIPAAQLQSRGTPNSWNLEDRLANDRGKWPPSILGKGNTDICNQIILTNDNRNITDYERELKLTELFSQAGIKINFED